MRQFHMISMLAVFCVTAQTANVSAQDWSGYYIGINAGFARGESSASTALDPNSPTSFFSPAALEIPNALLSGSSSETQSIGGIQIGRNWQSGSLVYGVEFDVNAVNLSMIRSDRYDWPGYGPGFGTSSASTDWIMSTRGRLGFVVGTVLFYGTAGLAATDLKIAAQYHDTDFAGSFASHTYRLSSG